MNNHLVFVYGTLRRGGAQAMSTKFSNSKFIAEAKVTGSLYDLGSYPGLLPMNPTPHRLLANCMKLMTRF